MQHDQQPFWRTKTLEEMTTEEWESLCDGCGRCCLVKLEDEDTAEVYLTRIACRLLDHGTCKCSDYPRRFEKVHDCIKIDAQKVREIDWLPQTCGYRLVYEGRDLFWWHPLISGDPETVHEAGVSVRGWAVNEARVKPHNMAKYIIKEKVGA